VNKEKIYANAFNQSLQIGPVGLRKIKKYFGGFEKGWSAPFSELDRLLGRKEFEEFRQKIDPGKEFEILEKENISVILPDEFPPLLSEIEVLPQILYVKGAPPTEEDTGKIHLAVVGTRKCTSYGKEACEKIVRGLKGHDITIVSGMALGIDTAAHKTAIENGMRTIAILGCGLGEQVLYPPSNRKLANEIVESGGCIISEYPYDMKAALFTFPQRNRIVAGLCEGTLVVEAPEKSGALITAFLALEYNREVFALPGGIFGVNSKGTNKLIKMGAIPVTENTDILQSFGINTGNSETETALSPEEERIVSLLFEPLERDELMRKSKLPISQSNPLLCRMEIKGIIKEIDGKIYKL